MREVLWIFVIITATLGLLLLFASFRAPSIDQAAVGSMVTAIVVCVTAIAYAATAYRARRKDIEDERLAMVAQRHQNR